MSEHRDRTRPPETSSASSPLVGISSCLLGEAVRYNGEHRKASLLLAELSPHVGWVPICPELEVGMGVPREPVHLVESVPPVEPRPGDAADRRHRLVGVETGRDWTRRMERFATARLRDLEELGLSGYIFKSRSPSCGVADIPVRTADDGPGRPGSGLFAAAVKRRFGDLPLAEETDLIDGPSCRRFLEQVLAHWRGTAANV